MTVKENGSENSEEKGKEREIVLTGINLYISVRFETVKSKYLVH